MTTSLIFCGHCGAQNSRSEVFCFSCGYELTTSSSNTSATSTPTGQLPARTLLKQRYQILQRVGKGGMGSVYRAEDTLLGNRSVAIKEMDQGNLYGLQVREARESFKQEAHLLAGLQHPNLPSIHDYFEEGGRWYLVMSFIQGETLEEYLAHAHDQKLALEETLLIGQELCSVLHYLHTYQPPIIFRDLKPSDIMRSSDGHIYLIGFGIARHFKPGQSKDTASYGSVGYAPPEQYGKAQTTRRSDIYSLGATLYQLLSGYDPSQSPFRFPPLHSLVPTLPKRLVKLIMQMVEMDESKRPENIKVVEQELQQVSGPVATPFLTARWRSPKHQTSTPTPVPHVPAPKQRTPAPTPILHVPAPAPTPIPHVPAPAPAPTTPYATSTPPEPNQHTLFPSASAQYASQLGQQIFVPLQQATHIEAMPAQQSFIKKALFLIGKIISIIGMVVGALSVLFGTIVFFMPGGDIVTNLWVGVLFVFFGLVIFFIARVRKSSLPVSKGRKTEAIIGKNVGRIGIIAGIIIIILGAITYNPNTNAGGGVIAGALIAIMGVVIWWVTRIRIKEVVSA